MSCLLLGNDILAQAVSHYGNLVSPIKKIAISSKSLLLKHVLSFRQFVYMIVKDNKDLDLTLNMKMEDFNYVVYATTNMMKCFSCSQTGHQVRAVLKNTVIPLTLMF